MTKKVYPSFWYNLPMGNELERLDGQASEPTVADNYNAMVKKIGEARDFPTIRQRRQAEREARGLARKILESPLEQRMQLSNSFDSSYEHNLDLVLEIYRTLFDAGVMRSVPLRELLGIRLYGPILKTRVHV